MMPPGRAYVRASLRRGMGAITTLKSGRALTSHAVSKTPLPREASRSTARPPRGLEPEGADQSRALTEGRDRHAVLRGSPLGQPRARWHRLRLRSDDCGGQNGAADSLQKRQLSVTPDRILNLVGTRCNQKITLRLAPTKTHAWYIHAVSALPRHCCSFF